MILEIGDEIVFWGDKFSPLDNNRPMTPDGVREYTHEYALRLARCNAKELYALKLVRQFHDIVDGWTYIVDVYINGTRHWRQPTSEKLIRYYLDERKASHYAHK